jgi:hypothetical protein
MPTTTDCGPSVFVGRSPPEHRNESLQTRVRSIPTLWLQGDSRFLKIGRMINVNTQPTKSPPLPILFVCHYPLLQVQGETLCCVQEVRHFDALLDARLYVLILGFFNDDFTCEGYLR